MRKGRTGLVQNRPGSSSSIGQPTNCRQPGQSDLFGSAMTSLAPSSMAVASMRASAIRKSCDSARLSVRQEPRYTRSCKTSCKLNRPSAEVLTALQTRKNPQVVDLLGGLVTTGLSRGLSWWAGVYRTVTGKPHECSLSPKSVHRVTRKVTRSACGLGFNVPEFIRAATRSASSAVLSSPRSAFGLAGAA